MSASSERTRHVKGHTSVIHTIREAIRTTFRGREPATSLREDENLNLEKSVESTRAVHTKLNNSSVKVVSEDSEALCVVRRSCENQPNCTTGRGCGCGGSPVHRSLKVLCIDLVAVLRLTVLGNRPSHMLLLEESHHII